MKKSKRQIVRSSAKRSRDDNQQLRNLNPFSQNKEDAGSEYMPSCFREMWDVFLSFSRLNY